MRAPILSAASCLGLAPHAFCSPAVAFLGTTAQFVAHLPTSANQISSLGLDADGNYYYANLSTGTVLRSNAAGNETVTLLSGLKQPKLVVDYRGVLFIADTGNNRVLSLAAGATVPTIIATTPAPSSIAVDAHSYIFFLSSGKLYESIAGGPPREVGAFPDATLLAYGPAAN